MKEKKKRKKEKGKNILFFPFFFFEKKNVKDWIFHDFGKFGDITHFDQQIAGQDIQDK